MKNTLFFLSFLNISLFAMPPQDFRQKCRLTNINQRNAFSTEILRTLYRGSCQELPLRIPSTCSDSNVSIKEIIGNVQGITVKADDQIISAKDLEWMPTDILKNRERASHKDHYNLITNNGTNPIANNINQLPEVLAAAKAVIKSFLLQNPDLVKNPEKIRDFVKSYIPKRNVDFNRLFTYAMFEKVIKEKNLTHVKLPHKVLAIWNNKTNSFLDKDKAGEVIDSLLTIGIYEFCLFFITTDFNKLSKEHELIIFASKETCEGNGFSRQTMNELHTLFTSAPFDVGFDNIFWDEKGDATIIDTECKSTYVHDIEKLKRYPILDSKL